MLALGMIALLLAGCDTVASDSVETEPSESNPIVEMLNTELDLTAAQQRSLREHTESVSLPDVSTSTRNVPRDAAPGVLWTVAANVHDTLTDAQKERLFERNRVLRRELRTAVRDARNQLQDSTLTPEQFRTTVQELRTDFREDAQAVLTDAQRERLQAFRAAAAERRAERKATRAEVLNLTDAQQEALGAARQDTRARIRTIRTEQISGTRDRDETRRAIRDARSAMHETLRDTLTDAQYETIRLHRSLVLRVRARLATERRG